MGLTSMVMDKNGPRLCNYYQSKQLPSEAIACEITTNTLDDERGVAGPHAHWLDVYHGIDSFLMGEFGQDVFSQDRSRTLDTTINRKTGEYYNDFTVRYTRDDNPHPDRRRSELFKLVETIKQHPEDFILSYGVINDKCPKPGVDPIPTDKTRFLRYVKVDLHAFVDEIERGNIVLDPPNANGYRPATSWVGRDGRIHAGWRKNKDKSSAFIAIDVGQLAMYYPHVIIDQHGFKMLDFEKEFQRQYEAGAFKNLLNSNLDIDSVKAMGIEVQEAPLSLEDKMQIWSAKFGDYDPVLQGHKGNIMRLSFELDMPLDISALYNLTEENRFDLDKRIADARCGRMDWADLKHDLVALDFVLDDSNRTSFEADKKYVLEKIAENRAKHPNRPFMKTVYEEAIEHGQELRRTRPDLYVKTPVEMAHNEARLQRDLAWIANYTELDELPEKTRELVEEVLVENVPADFWNNIEDGVGQKELVRNVKAQHGLAVASKNTSKNIRFERD